MFFGGMSAGFVAEGVGGGCGGGASVEVGSGGHFVGYFGAADELVVRQEVGIVRFAVDTH